MRHLFIVAIVFSAVLESWGITIPEDSIRHTSSFVFPNTLPNVEVYITKSCSIKNKTCSFSSNSPLVATPEDLVKLEKAEAQAIANKYGAITGTAVAKLQVLKKGETIDVIITIKEPEGIRYLDKTKNKYEDLLQQSRTISRIRPVAEIDAVLSRHGLKLKGRINQKSFRTELNIEDAKKIMFDKEIASIEEYVQDYPVTYVIPDQITSLAPSAYWHSTSAVPSSAGSGVNAATFELGIDPRVIDCFNYGASSPLNISQIDTATGNMADWYWHHSQWTFHSLLTAAPGANLWHRASTTFNDSIDSAYIDNNYIQTASLSYSRGGTSAYSETYGEFRSMDDRAYYAPYPVFCNPTGNSGYKWVANWQCFNAINVGNVVHDDLTHFELADTTDETLGCTQTKNPPAKYGSTLDREMPNLVAPGFVMHDDCVDNASINIWCGTSLSAPITNGLAADLIAADSRMFAWPEKVRAALLVTAQNVDRGYWSYTQDGRDGAGVVHGANAVSFAQGHQTVYPNGTAVEEGMGTGSIYASDFNLPNNPIVYNIKIPTNKPTGKHLRVVITWDSNPVLNAVTNELSDLDLLVTNGSAGAASQSNNSNIEMVDIPIGMYSGGSTVEARVTKWLNRIPSGSRANYFYYAIAWTWVEDHAE